MTNSQFLLTTREFSAIAEAARSKEEFLQSVEGHIVIEDCVRVLRCLPDNCVDLIHTSPPYNIDKPYQQGASDNSAFVEYEAFLAATIAELKRVLRCGGSMFWQTGYTQSQGFATGDILPIDIISYRYFREDPLPLILWDRIIWRYWGGHAFKKKFTNKHESILWFVKPGLDPVFHVDEVREKSKEYDKRNNFWGRNPGNVWEVDRVASGSTEQTSHIAVFPEEISEKIIRACSRPSDLVLDPFCGSGTAPKVARSLGRRWVGIEISPAYATEASVRIGFQQPSEVNSLASELLKRVAFHGKKGTLSVEEIARRLTMWAHQVSIEPFAKKFNAAVVSALADRSPSKAAKRAVWTEFDREIAENSEQDIVVQADQLLLRCYKNRGNLNGVSRYGSALNILGALISTLLESEQLVSNYVREIVTGEPSSFDLSDCYVTLKCTQRRIKTIQIEDTSLSDGKDINLVLETGGHEGEEAKQGRLLL